MEGGAEEPGEVLGLFFRCLAFALSTKGVA